jgi:predicted nuclease with RNAse H fold
MISTKETGATCTYLGVDITDRYSDSARPMDVCGLEINGDKLIPYFWTWCWGSRGSTDVTELLPEISAARAVMLDGPQGLARVGHGIRSCEKALAAAGKSADVRPPTSQPYGGFIASSLDLFAAFHAAELLLPSGVQTRLYEVYPATIWTRLARRLPNKRRRDGREARAAILKTLGVLIPEAVLSHDQLDAVAAALLGAAADGRIHGVRVVAVGNAVYWDHATHCLREGQILVPEVDSELRAQLQTAVRRWELPAKAGSSIGAPPRESVSANRAEDGRTMARPVLTGTTAEERGYQLLELLVAELLAGRPTLCTYKAAVAAVLHQPKYAQGYGSQLTKLASETKVFQIDGLGEVRLDTFVVNGRTKRPGDGHWESATYTQDEWNRAFRAATAIE